MVQKTLGFCAFLCWIAALSCRSSPTAPEDDSSSDSATHIDLPPGPISEVYLLLNPSVHTMLEVHWTQDEEVDFTWVAFSFEDEEWMASEKMEGTPQAHREVLLGVPENAEVRIRIGNETNREIWRSESFSGQNGSAPMNMPRPELIEHVPSRASHHRWLLGSVENTTDPDAYFNSMYYTFIIDREARVVWYHFDVSKTRVLFPRVAPSGGHILFDESEGFLFQGEPVTIRRTTLDFEHEEQFELTDMSWGYDVTDGGSILFDYFGILKERDPGGELRTLWDCQKWLPTAGWAGAPSDCFSNTVSWSAARSSVLLSHPWGVHAAIEIDRETGSLKSNFGNLPFSWDFVPADVAFDFQHYPNITLDGTLLVSSHVPNSPMEQRIMEFAIDDENQVLTQIWTYGAGIDDFASEAGEATRIDNGNTLVNFGTGGVIREVTPDKETVWHVVFDADFPESTQNKLLGHTVLIDDLYGLNHGL